jgi:hypothetical protein
MTTPASNPEPLAFNLLNDAVANAAAIRIVTRLDPMGGPGNKVFPPTYEGGEYAEERVWMEGREVRAVLLDSVQSQALDSSRPVSIRDAWFRRDSDHNILP